MFKNMLRLFVLCILFFAIGCAAEDSDAATITPPNIIIILADDMGFGDIGANGATRIRTPHIDNIAAEGVSFTQFYASANVCTPSRAGLMTGRYPIRTTLGHNVITAQDTHGLPQSEETIAELLKRAGYATKLIGKWHLGRFPDHAPMKHGFDSFFGVPHSNDMPDFALYRGVDVIENPVNQPTLTMRFGDEAVDFIKATGDRPFFLFVSHTAPHIPLYVSEAYAGKSDAGLYGDVIEELDGSVGKIIEALKSEGVYENTLIMITSDNGPFFEGGGGGLKGGKGSGWEGAYRVPFVVGWPNGGLTGGDNPAIAINIDILPTIADIVGVSPTSDIIDGRSLLLNFRGETTSPHKYLYYFNNEDIIGIRNQEWKFLTHAYYRRSLGAFEKFDQLDGFSSSYDLLFDASVPGGEEYSYADRHSDVVKRMKEEIRLARDAFDPYRTHERDKTFPE